MKATAMLEALEDAARRLEVRVSYEALAATIGHGGLCRVRGQYRVIIDKRATTEERAATLAQALGRIEAGAATAGVRSGADHAVLDLGLPPKVRELVDFYADRPASTRRAS